MITEPQFSPEILIEALEETRGFILAAKRFIKKKWGIEVNYNTIRSSIKTWGMEEWLQEIRTNLAEDCMKKAFHKGITEGDNHCLFWAINKYGRYVDFLDEAEPESKKGWREILEHVKGSPESQTN